jgi:hypothetical protein
MPTSGKVGEGNERSLLRGERERERERGKKLKKRVEAGLRLM